MEKFKKSIIVSVMITTVLSMSMLAVPVSVGATAAAGDLIKMDGLSSVYYLGADSKRYVFPNEQTYFSWYSDFSSVVTIPQSELESYSLGANVTIRPGTKLVKITTDPKVYAVESDGALLHVPDEATAIALFGDNWAQRVIDVPDAFFTNYTVSTEEVSATVYPEGSLIKTADASDVYYVDASGNARKITTEAAFTGNRFSWDDVITTTLAIPTAGTEIAAAEATLIDTSSGAGGTPVDPLVGTGLTVSLASDTAAAANIPAGSPNPFLKLNLTAASDGDVKVSMIQLGAYGLGTATYIDSVTFYDAGIKVGTSKNVNSDRIATFNFSTPIEVEAGTTKSLIVKATIQASQSGNFALGIASASNVTTDGAAVSGSFPITGNTQAIVSGVSIGTITMATTVGSTATTNDFGEDNVLLASFDLTAAYEPIIWESARFRNGGTNIDGIVGNIKLLIDGDEVATGAELVDRYVDFDLGNHLIAKNDTISVEVYGDIGIATALNTVNLYIYNSNDLAFVGQDYGYGVTPTISTNLDAVGEGIIVTLAAGDVTIDMDKSATPSKDVRPGDNDVVLATISIVSNGEDASITAIGANTNAFMISGTGLQHSEIENVELKDLDTGTVYDVDDATTTGAVANRIGLTMSDEISLVKGVTKTFELRCDISGSNDTDTIEANDTLQVTLEDGAFTITGDDSNDDLSNNITPTSITSAIATVKTASLSWTTTALTTKTIVPGALGVVIYRAALEAGESSAITLTSVKLSATTTGVTAFHDNNVSQMRLYLDGKLIKTSAGNINETGRDYINFTSLVTTDDRVIPAGASVVLEVKADFAGTFDPAGWIELKINSATADIVCKDIDSNAVDEDIASITQVSRTVKLTTAGTLKVELDTTDQKANANTIVLAGSSKTSGDKYIGKLKFTTANEQIKVKTLVLGQSGTARDDDIVTVDLYDENEVLVVSKAVGSLGHANFSALNLVLPADDTIEYFIGVTTKSINADGDAAGTADHASTIIYALASSTQLTDLSLSANKAVTAIGVESGEDITCVEASASTVGTGEYATWGLATSTTMTIQGAILTSIVNDMADGTLTAGSNKTIGKYKFVFDNGDNRIATGTDPVMAELITLAITMATSTGVHIDNMQVHKEGDSGNKTTAVQVHHSNVATSTLTTLSGETEEVDGEITLVITADISGVGTTDFIQTSIADLTLSFVYDGYDGWAVADTANPLLTVSEVIGGTLSN